MNTALLDFSLCPEIENLIKELENKMGCEINLREQPLPPEDENAPAKGGFEKWVPHVTINSNIRSEFNEGCLAHELLHIKRFFEGALALGTTDEFVMTKNDDQRNRISFTIDTTNQIEHCVIFPSLQKYGFDPNKRADSWKIRQIERFRKSPPIKWGSVDHAAACIKIGVGENIGEDSDIQKEYIDTFVKIDKDVATPGLKIGEMLSIWIPKAWHYNQTKRQYDYRRLYQKILDRTGVPKQSPLFLKKLCFKTKTEEHIAV